MDGKALIAVADGIEELEAITIIDCLGRAGAGLTVASVQRRQIITCREVIITADCLIADCTEWVYDLIVLPGGMPGAESLGKSEKLVEMLKKQ